MTRRCEMTDMNEATGNESAPQGEKNSSFSIFRGARGTVPTGQLNLAEMMARIRSEEFRPAVEAIREAKAAGNDEVVAELKKRLLAVTFSGVFTRRKSDALQSHSGLLGLDFDDLAPESLLDHKVRLAADPHVQSLFVSPGGAGLKVVVRVPSDPATHGAAFAAAVAYFKEAHGLEADQSGKDVSRLCFLSHDPEAFLRDGDAVEFVPAVEAPKPRRVATVAPPDAKEIRSALDALDPDIDYGQWIRIGMAIHSSMPGDDGLKVWESWSSGGTKFKAGECAKHWNGFKAKGITIATLFKMAQDAEWKRPRIDRNEAVLSTLITPTLGVKPAADEVEKPIVTLPSGSATITACAETLGKLMRGQQQVFNRGGSLVKVVRGDDGPLKLELVPMASLPSLFEKVAFLERITKDGPEPGICSEQSARLIANADSFREALPRITVISPCPVLVERDGRLVEVNGHDSESGIFAGGASVEAMGIEEALRLLSEVLDGFRFATTGDRARAYAAMITPALTFGGLLGGRPPIDLGEANDSQTGKGYRNKLVGAIYGQTVRTVTQKSGGVGSLEESFNSALIGGANFIALDNIRGKLDSPAIESFLTEDHYSARAPYAGTVDIDPRRVMMMFTSNKADVTQDLANRSSCVRILKHPDGHVFRAYPEGDILDHVRANQPRFLGAVFAIVRAWHSAGRPRSHETRHDFRRWAQVMDWICQNLLKVGPLLDGHRETQQRMTNPALSWLRVVAQAVVRAGKSERWLKSNAIVAVLEDTGIDIPGMKGDVDLTNPQAQHAVLLSVGRQLGRCFAAGESVQIDNMVIERREEYDPQYSKTTREYLFTTNHLAGGGPAGTPARAPDPVRKRVDQVPAVVPNPLVHLLDRLDQQNDGAPGLLQRLPESVIQPVGVN